MSVRCNLFPRVLSLPPMMIENALMACMQERKTSRALKIPAEAGFTDLKKSPSGVISNINSIFQIFLLPGT